MKKFTSFLTIALFTYSLSNSQIQIDSTHINTPGNRIELDVDTAPSISVGNAGSGQMWDFKSLQRHEQSYVDFESNSPSTPGSQDFPNSNIVLTFSEEDSAWNFLEKSDTALWVLGVSQVVDFDGIDTVTEEFRYKIISFPSSLNTAFTTHNKNEDLINFGVDPDGPGPHPTIDSIRYNFENTITSIVDADGQVQIKTCNYPTIRQKVIETSLDSISMFTNGNWTTASPELLNLAGRDSVSEREEYILYRWWTSWVSTAIGFPLVECEVDKNDNIMSEVQYVNNVCNSISERSNTILRTFPNPTSDQLNIELTDDVNDIQVSIFDLSGKLMLQNRLNPDVTSVDVSSLTGGIYLLRAIDNNNNIIHEEKISIVGQN